MSLVGYPRSFPNKFEHFGIIPFSVMLQTLESTPTLTFDLSTQYHTTCRISEGHSLYQLWTSWDHSFLSYVPDISMKNALMTLWPWPLTFEPQNSTICRVSQGHSLYWVWTLLSHSFLSYAADKQTDRQTNKQTDSKILSTPIDIVVVGNNWFYWRSFLNYSDSIGYWDCRSWVAYNYGLTGLFLELPYVGPHLARF